MQSVANNEELQAELDETSRPLSGQEDEEPGETESREDSMDSEGLPQDSSESQASDPEPPDQTERDAHDSPNEWEDIDLVR